MKSILETRPVYHQQDENIRGHVFCSLLALLLRKDLDRRLEKHNLCFEWNHIRQDLQSLQKTVTEEKGERLSIRNECVGTCGKVFKSVGVAVPLTIREL